MPKSAQRHGALSDVQERFCQEYILDLNMMQAAIRAGYAKAGAHVRANHLMASPRIRARIQELMDKRSKRTDIKADDVLRELLEIARSDLRKLFDDRGRLKDPKDWPDDAAKFVSTVDVFENKENGEVVGYTKKIKLWDKVRALELLARHLKLFEPEIKHSGSIKIDNFESLTNDQIDERIKALMGQTK